MPKSLTNPLVSGDFGGHLPFVTLMSSKAMSLENPLPRIPSIIIWKKKRKGNCMDVFIIACD